MDDALLLSRIQFAFVISFHILFPAFTIGLASWLAFLEGAFLYTRDTHYRDLYFFWLKIFAVSFGMGVVSGIVMSFQFGTNWARFSEVTGNIIGPLLSYEVLTAFFLEATFLGVMLFGWTRVSAKVHFVATSMVAFGTLVSTFWIISANSWMHTPPGYEHIDGVFHPADWWAVIFNPSFPYRLAHMVLAAFLTTAFVIGFATSSVDPLQTRSLGLASPPAPGATSGVTASVVRSTSTTSFEAQPETVSAPLGAIASAQGSCTPELAGSTTRSKIQLLPLCRYSSTRSVPVSATSRRLRRRNEPR